MGLAASEFKIEMETLLSKMNRLFERPTETVDKAHFSRKRLALDDIKGIPETCTKIVLDKCTSEEWLGIGKQIGQNKKLVGLEAADCDCSDQLLFGVMGSSPLRKLRLDRCKLTLASKVFLLEMKQLQELSINGNPALAGEVSTLIKELSNLQRIEADMALEQLSFQGRYYNTYGRQEYDLFLQLSHLKSFRLPGYFSQGYSSRLSDIASKLLSLTYLDISKNRADDNNIAVISVGLPLLEVLIANNNQIGDKGVFFIMTGLQRLKQLRLDDNRLTAKGVTEISSRLGRLQVLSIRQSKPKDVYSPKNETLVSDEKTALALSSLIELYVEGGITPEAAAVLLVKKLHKLSLTLNTEGIVAAVVQSGQSNKDLKSLVIRMDGGSIYRLQSFYNLIPKEILSITKN